MLVGVHNLYSQDAAPKFILPKIQFTNQKAHQVIIPFKSVNNLIIVPLQLNNFVTLSFLLDTGVKTPLLIEKLYADILEFDYTRTFSLQGAGALAPVQAFLAPNTNFTLPGIMFQHQAMLVLQEDYLQLSNQLGIPLHGIIGSTLFEKFIVKIDYEKLEITLYDPRFFKAPAGFQHFALSLEDSKSYVEAQVTGSGGQQHNLKMLLDTGASHAMLLHNENARVALPDSTIRGNLGRGLLGDINGEIGRLPSMQMGKFVFSKVLTSFPEHGNYSLNTLGQERDGTIGGEFLRRFTTYIDYPNQSLYLRKSKNYRDPFIFTKSGLALEAEGTELRTYRVTSVRPYSSGKLAGIQAGDLLLKIKGTKAKNFSLSQIQDFFRARDGKKIKLVLLRGEQQIKTTLILKDML